MAKVKAKTVTVEQLETLDADELRALCKGFIQQRDDHHKVAKVFEVDCQNRAHLMPAAATMMEALADRCDLRTHPSVVKMVKSLGDGTYPQWSTVATDLEALPLDAESKPVRWPGDAEMVLNSPIHESVQILGDTVVYATTPEHIRDPLFKLIADIEQQLQHAISTGFVERGHKALPPKPTPFNEEPPAQISTFEEVHHALGDMLQDIDFSMSFLRTDLRAAFYRSIIRRLERLFRSLELVVTNERDRARETASADGAF